MVQALDSSFRIVGVPISQPEAPLALPQEPSGPAHHLQGPSGIAHHLQGPSGTDHHLQGADTFLGLERKSFGIPQGLCRRPGSGLRPGSSHTHPSSVPPVKQVLDPQPLMEEHLLCKCPRLSQRNTLGNLHLDQDSQESHRRSQEGASGPGLNGSTTKQKKTDLS